MPSGREIEAGREVGRFHIMTHAYWREGGAEFRNVNIMGVAHGLYKAVVLAHKAAMDEHLASVGIPVSYTNVFWGGRSEIKPSEVSPVAYRSFCIAAGPRSGSDARRIGEQARRTMLDFTQVAAQMDGFTRDHADLRDRLLEALKEAGNRLRNAAPRWEEVQSKIADSRTSWLMPDWREQPDQILPLPDPVEEYTALATDGSQIVADRHDLALCYLINVGYITLRYGASSSARLRSRPVLATPDDTLLSEYHGDQDPIAPARLAMHRRMQEIAGLVELIAEEAALRTDAGQPVVRSGGASASDWRGHAKSARD